MIYKKKKDNGLQKEFLLKGAFVLYVHVQSILI